MDVDRMVEEFAARLDTLVNADLPAKYAVVKANGDQRFTLGVAYPANAVDAHGEFATPAELEKAAWSAIARGIGVGIGHERGADGAGIAVESYIHRGPTMKIGNETINPGDWLLGVVWTPEAWAAIKAGKLTGYSIEGFARTREDS